MKRLLLLSLFSSMVTQIYAQQDPQFTHYMFNTIFYNPSFAGIDNYTTITAVNRMQWLGYSPSYGGGGAPTTQLISITTPLKNSGIGGFITYDNLGPITNFQAQASYAYHFKIGTNRLSFGGSGGIYSQTINSTLLRAIDPADRNLPTGGSQSQIRFDFATGAYWQSEKFYAGLSVDHLFRPSFNLGASSKNSLQPHGYFTAGYDHQANLNLKFKFSTLVQSDFINTTINVAALAYLREIMWGGLAYRQGESVSLLLGYSFLKNRALRVGYSLDYIIVGKAAKQPTSQEIMLAYQIPTTPRFKKIIRTPRFRH